MLPPGSQHSDDKSAKEIILDDDECPLQIFREWPSDKGTLKQNTTISLEDISHQCATV